MDSGNPFHLLDVLSSHDVPYPRWPALVWK